MREEKGGFVVTWETVSDKVLSIHVIDGLSEDGAEASVGLAFDNMRTIDFYFSSIIGPVHLEGESGTRDRWLEENVTRGVVDKFEVGIGDIDGRVHAVGFVIADRVSVIATGGDFESGINRGPKHRTRYLTDATAKFGFGPVIFDDELGKVAAFTIHGSEVFHEGKFFVGSNEDALELFQGAVDIEDAVFRRTSKIGGPFGDEFFDSKAFDIRAFDVWRDNRARNDDGWRSAFVGEEGGAKSAFHLIGIHTKPGFFGCFHYDCPIFGGEDRIDWIFVEFLGGLTDKFSEFFIEDIFFCDDMDMCLECAREDDIAIRFFWQWACMNIFNFRNRV